MNGRVYDPVLARFLSPDPYVQMPDARSGFNRYSYCLNNPLVYTDPDGEFLIPLITTIAGAYFGGISANNFEFNPTKWNWKSFNTYCSIVSSGFSGDKLGNSIENYYKNKKYSRELGEFMGKRSSNSDFSFVSGREDIK